jgi:hypothetical protein
MKTLHFYTRIYATLLLALLVVSCQVAPANLPNVDWSNVTTMFNNMDGSQARWLFVRPTEADDLSLITLFREQGKEYTNLLLLSTEGPGNFVGNLQAHSSWTPIEPEKVEPGVMQAFAFMCRLGAQSFTFVALPMVTMERFPFQDLEGQLYYNVGSQ